MTGGKSVVGSVPHCQSFAKNGSAAEAPASGARMCAYVLNTRTRSAWVRSRKAAAGAANASSAAMASSAGGKARRRIRAIVRARASLWMSGDRFGQVRLAALGVERRQLREEHDDQ